LAKYKTLSAVEGAGAGVLGLPALAIDIPALIGLALRATNEYASCYGYDVAFETERDVALTVLGAASSRDVAAKQLAMNEVAKAATMAGKKNTWDELQRLGMVRKIRKLAEQLGIRLTKEQLAQVVPVLGGLVGAGFNAWYLHTVCHSAQMVYSEWFLPDAYGEDVVPYR